jgi:hypothetical protein
MSEQKTVHVQEGMNPQAVAQAFAASGGTEQRGFNPQAIVQALGGPPPATAPAPPQAVPPATPPAPSTTGS